MKMLRRSVCLLLCAALFLTLLAGCGKQEEPAEDFVVSAAVCGPLETLDPTMNTDVGTESLLSTLFEGLMRMRDDGAGKAVAVAGIAKEYIEEKNYDDTVTYTFTLRSAARWSDGERVTAEDFVYAWQRLVDPATASPNASLLSMVAGYDEVRESGDVSLLGVKAKGESTFLVTLSRPCAYFITSVCTSPATAPLRRDLVEGNASWAATADIVTNGPYTVGTWVKAAQLQTKRNGEYYESKLVVPDSICFRFETDAQTNYDQLLAGELDYTAKLPYAAIEQLAEDETWQPAPLAETVCVLYNHLTDTFSDAQLRRALGDIHRISAENLELLPPVTVLCDVDNPLCGPRGAAAVFGPQKGADPDMVQLLDAGLAHLAARTSASRVRCCTSSTTASSPCCPTLTTSASSSSSSS